jgi:hypothetical protein
MTRIQRVEMDLPYGYFAQEYRKARKGELFLDGEGKARIAKVNHTHYPHIILEKAL